MKYQIYISQLINFYSYYYLSTLNSRNETLQSCTRLNLRVGFLFYKLRNIKRKILDIYNDYSDHTL